MNLKAVKETKTGLNTQFVNMDSGRQFSLNHVVNQIEKGNRSYADYQVVEKANGTTYVRSKPDGNSRNNIE